MTSVTTTQVDTYPVNRGQGTLYTVFFASYNNLFHFSSHFTIVHTIFSPHVKKIKGINVNVVWIETMFSHECPTLLLQW